ncbi:MAG: hypothetical protein EAZ53_01915 [Bacteroidetes bacterium]|nr:MAG: hypothetical protein EAZ53_01915 [Bacteroidota bacterium]
MYISDFKLVDILRDKMGEDEARALVEYIEVKVEDKYMEAKSVFATKEDLLKLELKITETIHKNGIETQKLIADSKNETLKLIADSKFETIKWLFGLIIGSTIAIIATILTVMKMGGW